jgi:hypothetical protein
MTEREWLTTEVPWQMVNFARERAGARKLRLFACACCRSVLNEFAPGIAERSIVAAELFADGEIKPETLDRVRHTLRAAHGAATRADIRTRSGYTSFLLGACFSACHPGDALAYEIAQEAIQSAARAAADVPWTNADRDELPEQLAEHAAQCELLRCISGNPFAPVSFDPAWRTSDAVALARSMYESRDFSAMPILADALQEAGCENEQVLAHCREPRDHARGCWVCDALLGKA